MENKYDASPHGSNQAYKALEPVHEDRKNYVIVVAQRLRNEHNLTYSDIANILGTYESQLRRWLGL